MKERIAKRMAKAGLCSRRTAESWIEQGRVSVNGKVLETPAVKVGEDDVILVDGAPLPETPDAKLWLYHKPVGLITTHDDPEGRPTVFDALPEELGNVISVGRLDLNSEGLLLLTNHGELSRYMEHPSTGWTRRYRLRVRGTPDANTLRQLKRGIEVDGVRYGSIHAKPEAERAGANQWVEVSLEEGKNRELRKVFSHLGHPVSRLIRVAYGPFQLGNLASGALKAIPKKVIQNAVGKAVAL